MIGDARRLDEELDRLRKKLKGVEDFKVASEVFDKSTLLSLYDLANKGFIESLNGVIKTGKEANVFYAEGRGGEALAVKIHRVVTGDFKALLRYLEGDPRFRGIRKSRRSVVHTWVRKEYVNLMRAMECGVRVPRAVAYKNNVLVMEFIGDAMAPAPMLKDYEMTNPGGMFKEVLTHVRRLYCDAGLVHADLSEYNVLVYEDKPVLIDLSQAVVREHPRAEEFLRRDIANLVRFFGEYVDIDEKKVYLRVTGC